MVNNEPQRLSYGYEITLLSPSDQTFFVGEMSGKSYSLMNIQLSCDDFIWILL